MKYLFSLIFIFSLNSLDAQEQEEIKMVDKITYNYLFEIKSTKKECHKKIPQTNIYLCPDKNSILEPKIIKTERYSISILNFDSIQCNNTVEDFTSQRFEKKGIRIFRNEHIKVNNFEGKYIEMQADIDKKAIIIFIDGITFKSIFTISYNPDDKTFTNEIRELLSTLYFDTNQLTKEKGYNVEISKTKYKQINSNSSIDLYTLDGKNQSLDEPNFTITELPLDNKLGLDNIGNYFIGEMQKYGLQNVKTTNESISKNSYSIEISGKIENRSKSIYIYIVRLSDKTIAIFQGNYNNDSRDEMQTFIDIAKTIKSK
ncbi:MAG: hypothetical protein IPL95_16130 [Saprospiraceae bacterium]|nr:hypothetical protein [Saprospiraceae bacterium]